MTKYISVGLPDNIYFKLKEMKKRGEIMSISEFVRHLIYGALGEYQGRQIRFIRRATIEEEVRLPLPLPRKPKRDTKKAIYGAYQHEILKQLKIAINKRKEKRLKNKI